MKWNSTFFLAFFGSFFDDWMTAFFIFCVWNNEQRNQLLTPTEAYLALGWNYNQSMPLTFGVCLLLYCFTCWPRKTLLLIKGLWYFLFNTPYVCMTSQRIQSRCAVLLKNLYPICGSKPISVSSSGITRFCFYTLVEALFWLLRAFPEVLNPFCHYYIGVLMNKHIIVMPYP